MDTISMVSSVVVGGGVLARCRGIKWINDFYITCLSTTDLSCSSLDQPGLYLNHISFTPSNGEEYTMQITSSLVSNDPVNLIDGVKNIVPLSSNGYTPTTYIINDKTRHLNLSQENCKHLKIVTADDLCSVSDGVFALLRGGLSVSSFSLHDYRARVSPVQYGPTPYIFSVRHQFAKKIRCDPGTNRIFVQACHLLGIKTC